LLDGGICDGRSDIGLGSQQVLTLVFCCFHFHSTSAACSFFYHRHCILYAFGSIVK
jgi:hypothetical protein